MPDCPSQPVDGSLLNGRDKRAAFKNRWLKTVGQQTSTASSSPNEGSACLINRSHQATSSDEQVEPPVTGQKMVKNRWLKGLFVTSIARRDSKYIVEETETGLPKKSGDVCLMSDSPFFVLTVSFFLKINASLGYHTSAGFTRKTCPLFRLLSGRIFISSTFRPPFSPSALKLHSLKKKHSAKHYLYGL